jgi:hypothetical protein
MFLGSRTLGDAGRVLDFDFEAGKTYEIRLVPDTVKLEGLCENGVVIVAR